MTARPPTAPHPGGDSLFPRRSGTPRPPIAPHPGGDSLFPRRSGTHRVAALALLFTWLLAFGAHAADLPADPSGPWVASQIAALEGKAPDAGATASQAESLITAEDYAGALALYGTVQEEAPWWSAAPLRRCELLVALDRRSEAIQACRTAKTVRASAEVDTALAYALSYGTLTDLPDPRDLAEAHALLGAVLLQRPDDPWAATLRCHVAEFRKDLKGLKRCAQLVSDLAPDAPTTWYYVFLVHVARERWAKAQWALSRAEELGFDPDRIAELREEFDALQPTHYRFGGLAQLLTLLWVLSWLGIILLGLLLSTATRRVAERLARSPIDAPARSPMLLRLTYRAVLGLVCAWYWVSMPVVLVGLASAAAAAVLVFLLGELPAGFVWIIAGIALLIAGILLARLMVTHPRTPPGMEVAREAHPQLWALLYEVADRVGTAPVDRVFLTPGSSIFVYEDRSLGSAMRGGGGDRCIALGYGTLIGLTVGQLRSTLAHEYGHFQAGDTSGSGFALGVSRSVSDLVGTLRQTGLLTAWNPLTWLLRAFVAIFRMVAGGASRLREVEADRTAIRLYGSDVFVRGLQDEVRHMLWFDMNLHALLNQAIVEKSRLPDIFRSAATGRFAVEPREFEEAVAAEEARSGQLDDTHPPTTDRIRWAQALAVPDVPSWNDAAPCPSLFQDPPTVEHALNEIVRRDLSDWRDAAARSWC